MKKLFFIYVVFLLLFLMNFLFANITITFQGKFTDDSGRRVSGSFPVVFSIYDTLSGGSGLWTEIHTNVVFTDGIFTVELGKNSSLSNLNFDKIYYLGININNQGELTPRSKINYNMYSIKSIYADTAAVALKLADETHLNFDTESIRLSDKQLLPGINTKKIGFGTVNDTVFSYLSGMRSSIQNQLDALSDTYTLIDTSSFRLGNEQILPGINAEKIGFGLVTNSEFSFLEGLKDSIQNQLDRISDSLPLIDTSTLTIGDTQILSGINAEKIGLGSVNNTVFSYLSGLRSSIQNQLDALSDSIIISNDTNSYSKTEMDSKLLNLQSDSISVATFFKVGADSFLINQESRIGIGTNTPGAKVEIQSLGNDTSTIALKINNSLGSILLYIDDGGNIGVGTSNPTVKLEINGSLKVNGSITSDTPMYAVFAP